MFDKNDLESWISAVAKKLESECNVYMIGGGALSFRDLKTATKDVDLVVADKKEFEALDRAIISAGFARASDLDDEFYLTALSVYEKGDSRIDVFLNEVGKMLKFSQNMKKRAALFKEYGKLKIFLASNEDIFLFKAMTPRKGDIEDCGRLIIEGLNYNIIYGECIAQSSESKRWYFWLFEKICEIEEQTGASVPIKSKLFKVVKKDWSNKPDDFLASISNPENHIKDKKLLKQLKR
ncbi:MAG: DUF6036 family nucleotidyltransferase [Nanoarchaeota archaeon]